MKQASSETWHIATLILCAQLEYDSGLRTIEEQIRLICAPDADTAYKKALALGKEQQHSYQNQYGQTASLRFLGLEDLEELEDNLQDGSELRYRFLKRKYPERLVRAQENLSVYLAQSNRQALRGCE